MAPLPIWPSNRTFAITTWSSSRENKAGAELALALELEQRPIAAEGNPQAGEKTFSTREERDKAVLGALEQVRKEWPRTKAAQTALAQIGFHKLHANDAPGAQAALDDYLKSAGSGHPLRAFATEARKSTLVVTSRSRKLASRSEALLM